MRANFAGAEAVEQPTQTAETAEGNPEEANIAVEELPRAGNVATDATSGDAMQHYLREISVAELLTREQEVELAQRIEAGREAMLAALCRSELLRRSIKEWREGLGKNTVLLRDVVDLAATRRRLRGDVETPIDESGSSSVIAQIEAELMPDVKAAFTRAINAGKGRPHGGKPRHGPGGPQGHANASPYVARTLTIPGAVPEGLPGTQPPRPKGPPEASSPASWRSSRCSSAPRRSTSS